MNIFIEEKNSNNYQLLNEAEQKIDLKHLILYGGRTVLMEFSRI